MDQEGIIARAEQLGGRKNFSRKRKFVCVCMVEMEVNEIKARSLTDNSTMATQKRGRSEKDQEVGCILCNESFVLTCVYMCHDIAYFPYEAI